ncbi:MAG: hypothetical protein CMC35_04875 [Flavobacteriaceae bacterium]|nr:hypothetical protein [Flavobacteriaceae bacterium]|tara:strand:+ start:24493 stop:25290 length:798 start_codon:yes stop_codon:yes gene_type:complete
MLSFSSLFRTKPPKKARKQDQKKAVNLNWNARLFFQIGLIVSLLITTYVIENTYGVGPIVRGNSGPEYEITEPPMKRYVVASEIPPAPEVPKQQEKTPSREIAKALTSFTTTPDASSTIETPTLAEGDPSPTTPDVPVETPSVETPAGPTNILAVEYAPVFPGCEGLSSKSAQTECLSEKIRAFIGKKFNTEKFSDGSRGLKTIRCQFTIGADGTVSNIMARGPEARLEAEALRVLGALPKMQPGKQGETPVPVVYNIPIVFQVQ